MYKIPCHNCSCTYIGETDRSYGKRQEKHRKEVESISNRTLTWADQKDLAAITDHVTKESHVIDWSGAKILDREMSSKTRQLKESICVHKEVNCMNRDGEPTTHQRPMAIFWSCAHCHCRVTICLISSVFASGCVL